MNLSFFFFQRFGVEPHQKLQSLSDEVKDEGLELFALQRWRSITSSCWRWSALRCFFLSSVAAFPGGSVWAAAAASWCVCVHSAIIFVSSSNDSTFSRHMFLNPECVFWPSHHSCLFTKMPSNLFSVSLVFSHAVTNQIIRPAPSLCWSTGLLSRLQAWRCCFQKSSSTFQTLLLLFLLCFATILLQTTSAKALLFQKKMKMRTPLTAFVHARAHAHTRQLWLQAARLLRGWGGQQPARWTVWTVDVRADKCVCCFNLMLKNSWQNKAEGSVHVCSAEGCRCSLTAAHQDNKPPVSEMKSRGSLKLVCLRFYNKTKMFIVSFTLFNCSARIM